MDPFCLTVSAVFCDYNAAILSYPGVYNIIFCAMASQQKESLNYATEMEIGTNLSDSTTFLSESHKLYLIERHGTVDLDPIPTMDSADPYNWPSWKVGGNGTVFRIPS